jgi:carboxymethylenebutenolidase
MNNQNVDFPTKDGQRVGAYLATPDRLPAPAVLVLQEIFGVNDFIRGVANRLANSGFLALAPELYSRQEADVRLDPDNEADMARALGLLKGLDERLALADCEAALHYLRSLPIFTGKVASMGYCLGGKLAYLMATRSSVDAAVAYYATGLHTVLDEAANLRAPLLVHIAGGDFLCLPEAQTQIVDRLGALNGSIKTKVSTHIYPDTPHGFVREGKATYRPSAASLADLRTNEFLATYLR